MKNSQNSWRRKRRRTENIEKPNATNFVYDVVGDISDHDITRINAIETDKKIIDRMSEIDKIGKLKYRAMKNSVFEGNVMLIDSLMDEILGNLLMISFQTGNLQCSELITELEWRDPLGYGREGIYRYKFKKFLCAIALGMLPSKVWDGRDEANGGYIIVKTNGDIVAYHLYNRDAFETYLLNNTSFERASTSRYGYAELYRDEDGKACVDLNLERYINTHIMICVIGAVNILQALSNLRIFIGLKK